uniref:IS481 family transposase n=1 Tax=Maricaulis sp. TaxID=1486257 RepID=UPI0025BF50E4
MNAHRNARTTPYSRALIVERHAAGAPVAVIATAFGISVRTVYKWLARYRSGGMAALETRSSAPARTATSIGDWWVKMAAQLRRDYRMTAAEIAERLRLARSTVARWLTRMGLGRLSALEPRPPVIRYQRERPGELIHLDIKSLGRFNKPGHRVTGQRKGNRNTGAGWDCVHVAIDDATRLAYVEVLADQKRGTTTAFLVRALRWFRTRGITVERVMTDNGSPYVSRLFAKALRWLGIRHIRTRPYTPRTNGKAERFIQTLLREWAYAIPYRSSDSRNRDLARYLDWYNTGRPHYALAKQPP